MNWRTTFLLVVLGLCAFTAWRLGNGPCHVTPVARTEVAAAQIAGHDGAPPPSAATRKEVTLADAATLARPKVPADATFVVVEVVDEASGVPVPGVEVCWFDEALLEHFAEHELVRHHTSTTGSVLWGAFSTATGTRVAFELGWRVRTDAMGRALVSTHLSTTHVLARTPTHYGYVCLDATDAGVVPLRMRADKTLRVRVAQEDGTPVAAAPVRLDGDGLDWETAITDSAGVCEFPHIQQWVPQDRETRWQVALTIPGVTCVREFAAGNPPHEIVLTTPALGSMIVEVACGGSPMAGAWIDATLAESEELPDCEAFDEQHTCATGRVRFENVLLDRKWDIRISHNSMNASQEEVVGPTRASPHATVSVALPATPILVGRLLGPDGRAIHDPDLATDWYEDGSRSWLGLKVDESGRFEHRTDKGDAISRLDIRSTIVPGEVLAASLGPLQLEPGRVDLGDIRLTPLPLVVGGRLVFPPGMPNTDVYIEVQRWEGEQWKECEGLHRAKERDPSHFTIRGHALRLRHRLVFSNGNCLPIEPVEFEPGRTDLTVPVDRGNDVGAFCELPDGLDTSDLEFDLVPVSAPSESHRGGLRERQRGPGFAYWSNVPSGTYRARVRLHGFDAPIATSSEFIVPQEQTATLLDLREIAVARLQFEPAQPDFVAKILWRRSAMTEWSYSILHRHTLPLPVEPFEVVVTSPGFKPQRVHLVRGTQVVQLEPWPKTQVFVTGIPALDDGTSIRAALCVNDLRDYQAVYKQWSSIPLEDLLYASERSIDVTQGVASVDTMLHEFSIRVFVEHGAGQLELEEFEPKTASGEERSLTIQLRPDEVARMERQLRERDK